MSRVANVDGQNLPHGSAAVHIEDCGCQFGDGVDEVSAVADGRPVDEEPHLVRLTRLVSEPRIASPRSDTALKIILREVIRRNRVGDGVVYLQITRRVAPPEHAFAKSARPALVVTAREIRAPDPCLAGEGIGGITIADIRWRRCDIESIGLLPNVLGKQPARGAGAFEAWLVDGQGRVTEDTSTNAWIVAADGAVITRDADNAILNGTAWLAVLEIVAQEGCRIVEQPFTVEEAKAASEAFLTSTTAELLPVVRINGAPVGPETPGPLTRRLRGCYLEHTATAA